jgi:rare lipoprotein A
VRPAALHLALLSAAALVAEGCASHGRLPRPGTAGGQEGLASWYGPGFHGRRTASGERFDAHGLSAAHRTLPLGSRVRVTNLANGKRVVLRVTDRGPFVRGRIIDVSYGAAGALGMVRRGVTRVRVERLDSPPAAARAARARRPARTRPARAVASRKVRPGTAPKTVTAVAATSPGMPLRID